MKRFVIGMLAAGALVLVTGCVDHGYVRGGVAYPGADVYATAPYGYEYDYYPYGYYSYGYPYYYGYSRAYPYYYGYRYPYYRYYRHGRAYPYSYGYRYPYYGGRYSFGRAYPRTYGYGYGHGYVPGGVHVGRPPAAGPPPGRVHRGR